MARISGIVSHIIPAAPPGAAQGRQPAPESSAEPVLAVVSTSSLGVATAAELARGGAPVELLPGALFGLLRDQGLRTALTSCGELLEPGAARFRGVILCGDSPLAVLGPLLRLRRNPDTALLPIVAYLHREGLAQGPGGPATEAGELLLPGWTRYADAVLESDGSPAEASAALQRLRRVAAALSALPAPLSMSARAARRLLLLRMMLTRGIVSLSPQRDPHQPLGHGYPPLDLLAGNTLLGDLDALCHEGLLERSFAERVSTCPSCGDARLLFREVCVACLSADVRRGEVIHHYRCGHVAPELSFLRGPRGPRGEDLSCPSCGEALRHIGIDYERPASLLSCQSCDHLAAEGVTQARCLGCGGVHLAESIGERLLFSYQLTAEGRLAAASGQMPAMPGSPGAALTGPAFAEGEDAP